MAKKKATSARKTTATKAASAAKKTGPSSRRSTTLRDLDTKSGDVKGGAIFNTIRRGY